MDTDAVSRTLAVGDLAPEFELEDYRGDWVRLSELRGAPVIVFFYPRASSPGCTVEACTFRDRYETFSEAGVTVLGVSVDSPRAQARLVARHQLPFRLLTDRGNKVAAAWGVPRTFGFIRGRTTFLLDGDGRVVSAFTGQFRPVTHVTAMLAAVEALLGGASSRGGGPLAASIDAEPSRA